MAEADAVGGGDDEGTARDADPLEVNVDPGEQDKCRTGDVGVAGLPGGDGPGVEGRGLPGGDGPRVGAGDGQTAMARMTARTRRPAGPMRQSAEAATGPEW